ncbi:MAG: hypothetical protein LBH59_06685 [Planctomycetaceae bacterium]|nr:hypothetical protein [Planctomycetaceae bacterium]
MANFRFIFKTNHSVISKKILTQFIPKPVWAVGFALEQTLHVVTLAVFSYGDFKYRAGMGGRLRP